MKLSDYVMSFLAAHGVNTLFYLPGGGCMHLLDSMAKKTGLTAVSLLHEQAVAIATESYSATTGNVGVALVTTGPGATNTVTGVLAAYLDSTPCMFLSGQVKTADLKSRFGVRGHGSQEADIVSIIAPVTKYAVMVTDKTSIRYHLERAWHEAISGRPGPVWLDIPLDAQGAEIDEKALEEYLLPPLALEDVDVNDMIQLLNAASRPVLMAGNGLRGCAMPFARLVERLSIPVIPSWKAMDLVPNGHPLYAGRAGGMGDRAGNLAMQNADLIVSLGCRLDFSITGYDRDEWAPAAKKIVVEIDPTEISKLGVKSALSIEADVATVINALLARQEEITIPDLSAWKARIAEWKRRYPVMGSSQRDIQNGSLSTYDFVGVLCELLPEGAYVAPCSAGTTAEIFFQAFTVKPKQVIRSNHGLGAMGFEIPNAIGMCVASGGKPVVCVAGDGGMQLNIQELAVIAGRRLPIKVFVLNNGGYASIRNMQNAHFAGRHAGCDEDCGLYLPDTERLAAAYSMPYFLADSHANLRAALSAALAESGPAICEVKVEGECLVTPRTATQVQSDGTMRSSRLENQFPFLPEKEVEDNMIR